MSSRNGHCFGRMSGSEKKQTEEKVQQHEPQESWAGERREKNFLHFIHKVLFYLLRTSEQLSMELGAAHVGDKILRIVGPRSP